MAIFPETAAEGHRNGQPGDGDGIRESPVIYTKTTANQGEKSYL